MIHFVGAGSGAPDLITLRGKTFLEQADVIIYAGSLVNPQLLDYAKEEDAKHMEEVRLGKKLEKLDKTTVSDPEKILVKQCSMHKKTKGKRGCFIDF